MCIIMREIELQSCLPFPRLLFYPLERQKEKGFGALHIYSVPVPPFEHVDRYDYEKYAPFLSAFRRGRMRNMGMWILLTPCEMKRLTS
jgi:hypothetical protein